MSGVFASDAAPEDPSIQGETARRAQNCREARRLLDIFGDVVRELVRLHQTQFVAIVDGDGGATRFDLLIHEANQRKLAAKYAYIEHLEKHRCSQFN